MIAPPAGSAKVIVVMGVSASGKTSMGRALADRLGCAFEEGDDLHPPANVAKMASGVPLDDEDRRPWLDAVAGWIAAREAAGEWGVVSCSALKRAYRDRLRQAGAARLRFVLLDAPEAVLAARIEHRHGHFMPPSLLASQLATLERPGPDEAALTLDATAPMERLCDEAVSWLEGAGR